MAENILAAACESETRKAAKRMRLEIYQSSQVPALSSPGWQACHRPPARPGGSLGSEEPQWGGCAVRSPAHRPCTPPQCGLGCFQLGRNRSAVAHRDMSRVPQVTALGPRDKGQDCHPSGSLVLSSPSAGRAHRPGQAALPGLRSHHPLHLLTASLLLLPGPRVRQWRPQLQLPQLRGLGQQPAAPCLPPNRKSQ